MGTQETPTNWFTLMRNLIYPACLGTAIVWYLTYILGYPGSIDFDRALVPIVFAPWFIIYLCTTFTDLSKRKPADYGFGPFLAEFGECIVIIWAFKALGFIKSDPHLEEIRTCSALIFALMVCAIVGNYVSRVELLSWRSGNVSICTRIRFHWRFLLCLLAGLPALFWFFDPVAGSFYIYVIWLYILLMIYFLVVIELFK